MVIDVIVLAVLFISALISFIRGFVRETLTILGVGGGLAAAYYGGPMLSPFFRDWLDVKEGEQPQRLLGLLPYPILADILSYGLIFLAIVIVLSIVSHILAESIRAVGLGAIDRTLGVIFGLVRGLLLLGVLYLPIHLTVEEDTKKEWFEGSKTHAWLEGLADVLTEYLPEAAIEKIEQSVPKTDKQVDDIKEKIMDVKPMEEQEQIPAPAEEDNDGYSDEFREKMDKMFQSGGAPQPQPEERQPAEPSPEQPPEQP